MSLLEFKAGNHPQQVAIAGADDAIDDRATHPLHFDPISDEFGPFDLDVAAAPHNAKCERYFTREQNGLLQSWGSGRVWCNPPYSSIEPWVRKAWAEWERPDGPTTIVMLLPANRCEQKWWQQLVEPRRDRVMWTTHLRNVVTAEVSRAISNGVWAHDAAAEVEAAVERHSGCRSCASVEVRFLPGRMRFIKAGALDVGPNERPPFGCCLLIWRSSGRVG